MRKKLALIIYFVIAFSNIFAQVGSYPGSFSRMGFGARGLSMGNAMVSNLSGDLSGYYNPAVSTFQEKGYVNIGYTFLSLDRKLNFIGFAKKFDFVGNTKNSAGISFSWINSGVSDIDGRDADGKQTELYSTFENQFNLGTSFLLSEQASIGINFKLYYAKLFESVTATSVGFDLGAIYKATNYLTFGAAIKDIKSRYEWQTSEIYGSAGNTTVNKFPLLINLGSTYLLPKDLGLVSLEFEILNNPDIESDSGTVASDNNYIFKIGSEINVSKNFKIRVGLDRIDLSSDDMVGNIKPSAGFGFQKKLSKSMTLGLDYSFQFEPYSKDPIQNIGILFNFE